MNEFDFVINYIAVLVATVSHYALGALWYSPILLGKPWMKAMNLTKESMAEKNGGYQAKSYIIIFIGTLVLTFVTAHMVQFMKVVFPDLSPLSIGLNTGFWLWLGYIATFALTQVAFEHRSWRLYAINNGFQLAGLLIVSVILSIWI